MQRIDQLQEKINIAIAHANFAEQPAELYDPIVYTMSLGGKRLRPALTLLACDMFNGNVEDALHPALAIEIFHNFTLLHDDIMDKSPLRRNHPSVWKKWNENIAILSGDTMLIMAYEYLMKTRFDCLVEILTLFNRTATEVCQGQQYDMNFETSDAVGIDDYVTMIRLKTAVLIASSLKTGAIIANASVENANMLYQYGESVGIAFQLMDDYLDVFGSQDVFGKQTGNDILTNKKTYLYLKAFETAGKDEKRRLEEAFSNTNSAEKITQVTELYRQLKADKLVLSEIDQYHKTALSLLDQIDVTPEKKVDLFDFAEKLIRREF